MAIETYEGHVPEIHESAFVADSADLIGRVTIGDEASVWYNATLRGDINEIVVGPKSNVQDNAVIHGAVIGERSIIGAQALVTGGMEIPPGSLVLGSPARVVKTLDLQAQNEVKKWAEKYVRQSRKFKDR